MTRFAVLSKTFGKKKRAEQKRAEQKRAESRESFRYSKHGSKHSADFYNAKRAHSKREKKQNSGFLFIITHIVNNI